MAEGQVHKRIRDLDITIESATERVPDDGRFYILEAGEIKESCASLTIAEALIGMVEEEALERHPEVVKRRGLIMKERTFREIISARAESAAIGKGKATAKGGKGGRSGV